MARLTISVVSPAFNEEKYIAKMLESLKAQTVLADEIIVADNNSTDATATIARKYGAKVVPVRRQGYVYAFSEALEAAKSDIVACIDSDTIADPHWIEEIHKIFDNERVVGATGSIMTGKNLLAKISDFIYYVFLQLNFWCGVGHLVGFNLAIRKKAIDKIGGVNLNYTMSCDVELGMRLGKVGKVVLAPRMITSPSMRRWEHGQISTLFQYIQGYVYVVFLHRPMPFKQQAIR